MMRNYDLFLRDPRTFSIPNEGVSKVGRPTSDAEWEVFRFELESFVCEGEYASGLERILDSFLRNLGRVEQPAVWISGFYGSGKSHLVRVLEALWCNTTLPSGEHARDLVAQTDEVQAHLRELTQASQREGGLWSAAGSLGTTTGSLRMGLLSIVLRSAGLPESYPLASFSIWLRQEGYHEPVRQQVESQGRTWDNELANLYVSRYIAEALMSVGAFPQDTPAGVQAALRAQFPPDVRDVGLEDMLRTLDNVLELQSKTPGKLPLTLIVLDEVQQHLHDDPDRVLELQNVVQACCSRFDSRLLLVGTGQAALQGSTPLSKLQDRFGVKVTLQDRDVHQVTRAVVLAKKPECLDALGHTLDQVRGEIDRHLLGTRIAPRPTDVDDLPHDYPLLPTRLRFWDVALRQLDVAGTSGQLRTQLRIIQEANKSAADQELGVVVPADFIYEQSGQGLVTSGAISREMYDHIAAIDRSTPLGDVKARVCAMAFLIGRLPNEGPNALQLRATLPTLGDLLCRDLRDGDAGLRDLLPKALCALVEDGMLMEVDGEYRLQSREATEWIADFKRCYTRIHNDTPRIASERDAKLRAKIEAVLKPITLRQGDTKTPRKFDLVWDDTEPTANQLAVWVRDGWKATERAVREAAQAAGIESPVVYVFVPRPSDDDVLRDALAGAAAAQEVLDARGPQTTPEGLEARGAMESCLKLHSTNVDTAIDNLVNAAQVYQGGGSTPSARDTVAAIEEALRAGIARLYPLFGLADDPHWSQVLTRIREGNNGPLSVLGYFGDAHEHPVCKEVLKFLDATAVNGSKIRGHFASPPYGWPQDAIDGALLALVAEGRVNASEHGQPVTAQQIEQGRIGVHTFRNEDVVITMAQRMELRRLFSDLGIPFTPNNELAAIPALIRTLGARAAAAGGEPPRPAPPSTALLAELEAQVGNKRLQVAYEQRQTLWENNQAWLGAAKAIAERLPVWEQAEGLAKQADGLPGAAELAKRLEAIRTQRLLLADPDPVRPLRDELLALVRAELQSRQATYQQRHADLLQALAATAEWQALEEAERDHLLGDAGLRPLPTSAQGNANDVLAELGARPLSWWENASLALDTKFEKVRLTIVRSLKPEAVSVPVSSGVLSTVVEVDAFLAQLRAELVRHIEDGHPVVVL